MQLLRGWCCAGFRCGPGGARCCSERMGGVVKDGSGWGSRSVGGSGGRWNLGRMGVIRNVSLVRWWVMVRGGGGAWWGGGV